jgi:ADP-ribose pyrophosphatase YjhB (NUDIX family)
MSQPFTFCPYCGLNLEVRSLGNRDRRVCPGCGFVQWRNPVVGVAVILMDGHRILLGQRARGPYAGSWCIPCGYVEYDEEVREAAAREFREETGLKVRIGDVYTVHSNFHDPAMHSVGIWFRGAAVGGDLQPADDLRAVDYFPLDGLPDALAFPTDRRVLERLRQESGHGG